MPSIYCTIDQLSGLFHVDYSTMHRILHQDARRVPEIKKLGRYDLNRVVLLHKTMVEQMEINLDSEFLNLHEVQAILHDELGPMVYSTVLRKAMKGEIPALKFGDTSRVPKRILIKFILKKRISVRKYRRLIKDE